LNEIHQAEPQTEITTQAKQWAMFLHLSMLAGFIIPVIGTVVPPIILWQLKKDEMPWIDAHGKNAVNWIISAFIYLVVCIMLSVIFIGILLAGVLFTLGMIFPIVAGIKANNGEVWKYPLAIQFLK